MSGYDLHTHSSVSDGTDTVLELVAAVAASGISGFALTDHDSTAGWVVARGAAEENGVGFVPGVELSTSTRHQSVHILGYLVDPLHTGLVTEMRAIREQRRDRVKRIVERITVDYELTWDDILAHSTEGATIGRPHIADALITRGYVVDRAEAFAGILHPRSGYTTAHHAPETVDGVALIRAADGVPVLAHPGVQGPKGVISRAHLGELVDAGLFGIEIDHPENDPAAREQLLELALEFKLHITGSSDYHGNGKVNRIGDRLTAPDVVDAILSEGKGSVASLP